jgi:hypothetical protein
MRAFRIVALSFVGVLRADVQSILETAVAGYPIHISIATPSTVPISITTPTVISIVLAIIPRRILRLNG